MTPACKSLRPSRQGGGHAHVRRSCTQLTFCDFFLKRRKLSHQPNDDRVKSSKCASLKVRNECSECLALLFRRDVRPGRYANDAVWYRGVRWPTTSCQ